jgi:putative ABC transport system permease protein
MSLSLAGFVFFIFIVAIIVIMNTLSMSAIERTSEIGMMRAVGARKSFIARMFFTEIFILSGGFGGLGILTGIILTAIVASLGITTDNGIAQLLFGGDSFIPILTVSDILACIFELILVTLLAWVYPARIASRITPLEAIARE